MIIAIAFRNLPGTTLCSEYLELAIADWREMYLTAHTDRHHPIGRYHT